MLCFMKILFFGGDEFSLRCLKFIVSRISTDPKLSLSKTGASRLHNVSVVCPLGSRSILNYCSEAGLEEIYTPPDGTAFSNIADAVYEIDSTNCDNLIDPLLLIQKKVDGAPRWLVNSLLGASSSKRNPESSQRFFDIMLVVSFKYIFPENFIELVTAPRYIHDSTKDKKLHRTLLVNIHPSHLPRFRGASPIFHSLLFGDVTSAVSFFRISPLKSYWPSNACETRVDTGPIIHTELLSVLHDSVSMDDYQVRYPTYGDRFCQILDLTFRGLTKLLQSADNSQLFNPMQQRDKGSWSSMVSYIQKCSDSLTAKITYCIDLEKSKSTTSRYLLERLNVLRRMFQDECAILQADYEHLKLVQPSDFGLRLGNAGDHPLYSLKAPKLLQQDEIGRVCFEHMTNTDISHLMKALTPERSAELGDRNRKMFGKSVYCSFVKSITPSHWRSMRELWKKADSKASIPSVQEIPPKNNILAPSSPSFRCEECPGERKIPNISPQILRHHIVLNEVQPIEHVIGVNPSLVSCRCEICILRESISYMNRRNIAPSAAEFSPKVYSSKNNRALDIESFKESHGSARGYQFGQCPFEHAEAYSAKNANFSSKICFHRYSYLRMREKLRHRPIDDLCYKDDNDRVFLRPISPQICYSCSIPPGSVYVPLKKRYDFIDPFANITHGSPNIFWLLCGDSSILAVSALTMAKCQPIRLPAKEQRKSDGPSLQYDNVDSFLGGFGLRRGVIYPGLLQP
ncbi:methionyl-tRNA formyltransferase [Perkinsela sp. CCAP 1560/4]|nr:methionyl-tRNA formyltransferase [Perkinsela sp. CCAP 1560/4]|eukprot:KNH08618.1 methionyl-tRNA formyltransferase [Perkinsela sp. CCAP 1560/4]